jgi:hypothetical protein
VTDRLPDSYSSTITTTCPTTGVESEHPGPTAEDFLAERFEFDCPCGERHVLRLREAGQPKASSLPDGPP